MRPAFTTTFVATPILTTLAESPLTLLVSFFASLSQLAIITSQRRSSSIRCTGTNCRVRYKLRSPKAGFNSCKRSRMVTLGHTIKIVSGNRSSVGEATRFKIDHADNMPITVVFPVPVAIFKAYRTKAEKPFFKLSPPGLSRGISGLFFW